MMVEGNLEVKLPTIWTDEEQRRKPEEKVREEKRREEKRREEKATRKSQESHKKVTCRPSGATKHWKNVVTVFRDLPTFSHTCIFCLVTFL